MPERWKKISHWRGRAEELRHVADGVVIPSAHDGLIKLAEQYERLHKVAPYGLVPRHGRWRAELSDCHDDPQPGVGTRVVALRSLLLDHFARFRSRRIAMLRDQQMGGTRDIEIRDTHFDSVRRQ